MLVTVLTLVIIEVGACAVETCTTVEATALDTGAVEVTACEELEVEMGTGVYPLSSM